MLQEHNCLIPTMHMFQRQDSPCSKNLSFTYILQNHSSMQKVRNCELLKKYSCLILTP